MRSRCAGMAVGLLFGVVLAWSGMTSPVVIRQALLFERAYLFLFFASAVLVAAVGLAVVRRFRTRAVLSDTAIGWRVERPGRHHIVGSLIFGIGWGVADACPGPIATQVGQGILWGLFTFAGVVIGVTIFLRRGHAETEPAADHTSPHRSALPAVTAFSAGGGRG
jgi:uncharacterized protein